MDQMLDMTNCEKEDSALMTRLSSENPITIPLDGNSNSKLLQDCDEFHLQRGNSKMKIRIDFNDLSYSVRRTRRGKCGKEILHKVNGFFCASGLNAIIGPSGAGKSTLINAICGMNTASVCGDVHFNGITMSQDELRKIVCYIPQKFALMPWLTTEETLYFAARLKILKKDDESFKRIVMQVADQLGLVGSLHTMTKRLSGGEQKRLAIAIEIVVHPTVLILDEPTSGLDSITSGQVISLLKNMAENGCTIVCTIHQPNSRMMTMFDNVLVIAEGRDIYCGPVSSIIDTFKQGGFICPSFYNIGEFVIEAATGQRTGDVEEIRKLCRHFSVSSFTESEDSAKDSKRLFQKNYQSQRSITWTSELWILLGRAVICVHRDCTMTKMRLAAHIIIGFLLGTVFYNFGMEASKTLSNIACLFFFLLFLFFANAMPAVQMFPIEAAVFAREYSNNWYSLKTYYIAKIITDLPLQVLCPTFFLIIAYSLTGQPLEVERFMKVWLVCFLLSILAQAVGILTGAAFNTHIGCFLVPALNIPMFLFAGFFLKLNEIPKYLHIFRTLSFFRYAFEGVLQGVYDGEREKLECAEDYCMFRSPKLILSHMDMPSLSFTIIIAVLILWILCLHTIIYIVLRCKLLNVK